MPVGFPEAIWERVRHQSHRRCFRADPLGRIRELLNAREPFYRQADVLVNTEMRSAEGSSAPRAAPVSRGLSASGSPVKQEIQQRARELGFDDCRVTTANPPDNAATFQRWLAAQYRGEMGYLERNAYKRIDPDKVLSGARSIVTLAASYHRADQNTGSVARYARFSDYHDTLAGSSRH